MDGVKARKAARWIVLVYLSIVVAMVLSALAGMASGAVVTIEDIGVDTEATADAVGTALGGVVSVMLPIAGAFLVIRVGVKWMKGLVR